MTAFAKTNEVRWREQREEIENYTMEDNINMSTIIVTGGAGFIGGNFIHYHLKEASMTAAGQSDESESVVKKDVSVHGDRRR